MPSCFRRFKPEVVVTQDENGEYGHGAHRLAVKVMKEAVHLSIDPSKYPASVQEYGTGTSKNAISICIPKIPGSCLGKLPCPPFRENRPGKGGGGISVPQVSVKKMVPRRGGGQ